MSISVATGFHRFVCGVRPFRGLQGKQRGHIPRVVGATGSPGRTYERDPPDGYLALRAAEATRDLPEGLERLVCLGSVIVECYRMP
jgi:hypothetical protein